MITVSTYFEVINSNGVIQITDAFKNLALVGKETATVTTTNTISFSSIQPSDLVAFRCNNGYPVATPFTTLNVGAEITIYRFNYPVVSRGNNFEVRNASGDVVFSDNEKYMKVVASASDVTDVHSLSVDQVITTVYHPSNLTTAVLAGSILSASICIPNVWRHYSQCFTFSSGVITSTWKLMGADVVPGGFPYIDITQNGYNFLVLDVTNL